MSGHPLAEPTAETAGDCDKETTIVTRAHLDRLRGQCERYKREARTDTHTGLLNARGLNEVFRKLANRFRSGREGSFGLLLLDLKHFKRINDRRGLSVGNQVLAHFGRQLRAAVEQNDIVGRFGGDEFVIVVRGIASEPVFRRVIRRLEGPYLIPSGRRRIRLSVHVVGQVATLKNLDRLEAIVQARLSSAKRASKARDGER